LGRCPAASAWLSMPWMTGCALVTSGGSELGFRARQRFGFGLGLGLGLGLGFGFGLGLGLG